MPEAGRVLVVVGLAMAGLAMAGCVPSVDHEAAVRSGAAAVSASEAPISPPPANPADVATDSAVPTEAAVQITYAGPDEAAGGISVGAYVAGILEQGGRCTLTLTKDGASATADSEARPDVTTTSCGQMTVPFSDLEPGTWTAEVTYASARGLSVVAGRVDVDVP